MDGTSATHPFTCLSCNLAFVDAQSQRDHYATELHRYNSRRRVAGLPALTQELFDEKVKERVIVPGGAAGAAAAAAAAKEAEQTKRLACKACK